MFFRRSLLAAACIFGLLPAHAQDTSGRPYTDAWRVGAIVLVRNGGYIGNVNRTLAVPAIGYEGEHLYFRGLQLGWHAWRREGLRLDFIAQARLDGFDAEKIPIAGLEDRRKSLDIGAVLSFSAAFGKLELTTLADALNRSGGQELVLSYGYPIAAGRVRITPQLGLRWWSHNLADYYYGIRAGEVARGAPAVYTIGDALVPEAGVNVVAPLGRRWSVWSLLRYQHLPAAVADSPLVARSSASTVLMGVTYAF